MYYTEEEQGLVFEKRRRTYKRGPVVCVFFQRMFYKSKRSGAIKIYANKIIMNRKSKNQIENFMKVARRGHPGHSIVISNIYLMS